MSINRGLWLYAHFTKYFVMIPKKKENIAEYLLFMWQMEDLLRVCQLDIDRVYQQMIAPLQVDDQRKAELRDWYEGLIMMMKAEGVQQTGHLQINKNVILELTDTHNRLLKDPAESVYIGVYYNTLPHIVALRAKAGEAQVSEIETCFTALYGLMLLRLQHKEVSADSQAAFTQISKFIALLADKHKHIDLKKEE